MTVHPIAAPFLFILAHILMAVFFIPCSPMTVMAGMLWGGVYGAVISMCAALASSATTFFLSKSLLRDRIENIITRRYPKVLEVFGKMALHDWKVIALSQLNPFLPASTMGYVFGLSRFSFFRYIFFSGIFMLPLQIMFVSAGYSLSGLYDSFDKYRGIAFFLVLLVIIFIVMAKPLYNKLCQFFGVNNEE